MSRRQKNFMAKKAIIVLFAAPFLLWGLKAASPYILSLAAKAAMVSACFNMPEGSLAVLEERFNSELFGNSEKISPTVPIKPHAATTPQAKPSSEAEEENSVEGEDEPEAEEAPPKRDIPEEYRGTIKEVQYAADSSLPYIRLADGYIKNTTKLSADKIYKELEKPLELDLTQIDEPQVLIVHTHATEAYEPLASDIFDTRYTWRNIDNEQNMVAVGRVIADELKAAGIGVIHDGTQHDYPTYNGAYGRSAKTVVGWLAKYPTIKVVLDIHRDAIQPADDIIVKAVAEIDGKKAAQVMIITGCDDGTMNVPDWAYNLRFAAALQSSAEGSYNGLMRPVLFCYRKYNMDLTRGSVLLEIGGHGNTLDEAKYSAELIGKALASLLEKQ